MFVAAAALSEQEDDLEGSDGYLLDKILDQSGQKGTGKWTVQEAANVGIAVPVISAALETRFVSARKEERVECEALYRKKQVRRQCGNVCMQQGSSTCMTVGCSKIVLYMVWIKPGREVLSTDEHPIPRGIMCTLSLDPKSCV